MKIGTDYRITSDPHNIILSERHFNQKQGCDEWHEIAFFGTLHAAYNHILTLALKETDLSDLETIIQKLNQVEQDIKNSLTGIPSDSLHETLSSVDTSGLVRVKRGL